MDKYVYISGGGSGIGYEIAKLCMLKGWTPIILGRREPTLLEASKSLDNCPYLSVDLSKEESKKVLRGHFESLPKGELIGLINNAGVYTPAPFLESTTLEWTDQFQVNVLSSVYLSQEFFEELKEVKGSIVNISSTLGIRPILNTGAYSASKAAMNNLTLTMALEFAPSGVRVNAVCPGIVNTPIHGQTDETVAEWKEMLKDMQPLGRVGEPLDIAQTAIHLLEQSNWTTGSIINIDGGILLKS
ncbi:MAG: SDR family NAD(P)-dependent oxidoreductase [Bdellovibrionales bacterium]